MYINTNNRFLLNINNYNFLTFVRTKIRMTHWCLNSQEYANTKPIKRYIKWLINNTQVIFVVIQFIIKNMEYNVNKIQK